MSAVAAPRPVLVTRPAGRGETLFTELERRGIEVVHQPLIRLVAEHGEELDAALARLRDGAYTHLVVTSRTAAEVLAGALVPPGTAVHAVGKGTAEELRRGGIPVSHVAAGSGAELVEEMPPALAGASVLFPASAAASRTVPEGLRARGYRVHEVTAYRPVPVEPPAAVAVGLATGRFGALALTSPMIARRAAALGVQIVVHTVETALGGVVHVVKADVAENFAIFKGRNYGFVDLAAYAVIHCDVIQM